MSQPQDTLRRLSVRQMVRALESRSRGISVRGGFLSRGGKLFRSVLTFGSGGGVCSILTGCGSRVLVAGCALWGH